MTTKEVAELLGLSVQRVQQASKLYARKVGRDWCWDMDGVKALRSRIGKHDRLKRSK